MKTLTPADHKRINDLEAQLPQRCRFWMSDAFANGESVGDVGDEVIKQLRKHGKTGREACDLVNELIGLYGETQSYTPREEIRK